MFVHVCIKLSLIHHTLCLRQMETLVIVFLTDVVENNKGAHLPVKSCVISTLLLGIKEEPVVTHWMSGLL